MEFDLRRKRTEIVEENNDYLTKLPEHLLHYILSFLSMKDVIRTCVLSKRWRYIWLSVPCLNFPVQLSMRKEIDFIDQCLLLYTGLTIQKLNISLKKRISVDSHRVDWWTYFGLIHKVKELHLFMHESWSDYTLHRLIFLSRSLTVLELGYCNIYVPKGCKLDSLKTLSLERVHIRDCFYRLTSSCPRLERVSLTNCNMKASPGLSITNDSLKTLKICTDSYQASDVEVYAPHLITLESMMIASVLNICVFKRMQALEKASFVCCGSHWLCRPHSNMIRLAIDEMLENVCHVKTLRLDSCYLEVIGQFMSIREKKGDLSFFNVKYLEIQTGMTKLEIPGLAYMLKCSPNVETLVINTEKLKRNSHAESYSEEEGYWIDQDPIVFGMLKKLKIVRVFNYLKNFNVVNWKDENAVKWKDVKTKMGAFAKKLRSDMDLLKFFLKNCEGLEKMVISSCVDIIPKRMKSRLMRVLRQDLLAFPAANRNVKISFA